MLKALMMHPHDTLFLIFFTCLLMWHYLLFILGVWICRGTFVLAFCSCGILHRINTAVFGAWEMIFAKELCHIRPSNRPLTSCLSESYLAGYLCEWMAVWLVHLRTASQTQSTVAQDNDGDLRVLPAWDMFGKIVFVAVLWRLFSRMTYWQ